MVQRKFLTGLAVALLAAQACGSDDGKKKAHADADAGMAGMAGQAGSPETSAGGSSAGDPPTSMAGQAAAAGTGGAPPQIVGGAGGAPEVVVEGGAGGQPPSPPPEPELLFSVKNTGGSPGLSGTAVNATRHPQNNIFTSSTGRQSRDEGTNAVKVTGAELGLEETDPIIAFSLVVPEPANPLFLFSVTDGSEGANQSRVDRSYHSPQEGSDEQANLYYSEGTQSTRYEGEGGDLYGYNAILATEASLGLIGGDPAGQYPDDLIGMAVHDARLPLTDIYFTVAPYAAGAPDSAVATVPAEERGCTVFKSARDGSNSVAFTCAELGLVAEDQIDGLALWGDDVPSRILFSVTEGSLGAADTAVWGLTNAVAAAGATIFTSPGNGSNEVFKSERDLGLGERDFGEQDDIDGFTIIDSPAPRNVAQAGKCTLSYDPFDGLAGDGLTLTGASRVGANVFVLFVHTETLSNRLLAYDATTCAFLQQKDMPAGFEDPTIMAIVPLPGWSPSKPFDGVEYLAVTNASQGTEKAITRYDAAGAFVASFPITGSYYGYAIAGLVHDPVADQLYMLVDPGNWATLWTFPRPKAADTALAGTFRDLTTPCANAARIAGTDAAGNLMLAKRQVTGTDFRVCSFTPGGEVVPLPARWSVEPVPFNPRGFIAPNGNFFVLHENDSPFSIERGVYQSP